VDLLPLPVGTVAQPNANSNSITLLAEREMAGRGTEAAAQEKEQQWWSRPGDVRDEATPVGAPRPPPPRAKPEE
jgi:hypothetical protein